MSTVELEIECSHCGDSLGAVMGKKNHSTIEVDICEKCAENAKEQAREEIRELYKDE